MKKVKFKWSYNEAQAILGAIGRILNSEKQVRVEVFLVNVIMVKVMIKMRTRLIFRYENKRSIAFDVEQAIAMYCLLREKKLDYFTSYEAACILPLIEQIDKTIIKSKV